jgi:hypothetical protein
LNGPRKLLFTSLLLFVTVALSSASDIYIAQNAAGGNNGADCADAYAKSYLDTGGNWKAGNTYHLCGTFTAPAGTSGYINVGASGKNGSPITLLFENGAVLTSAYWAGSVIAINGNSYITIDGGTNGIIQATANGTNLANKADNGECVTSQSGNATNVTVQNLTCANLYVDASPSDNGGEDTYGFDIWNTSNLVIQNNTIHDVKWAIRNSYGVGSTYSNLTVTGNNIYNMDHGWFGTDSDSSGSAVMSGFYIYGNTLGSMTNWDNTANNNHHDWFHHSTNSAASRFTDFYLYNNVASGDVGSNANGGFFSFPGGPSAVSGVYVFNNVFVNTSSNHCWANGFVSLYSVGAASITNNTFVSNTSSCKDNGLDYNDSSTGLTFENNIAQNTANSSIYVASGVNVSSMNYNVYYQSLSWFWTSNWYSTLSSWQSASHLDAASTVNTPKLTSSYHLTDKTSSAWQTGSNLYNMCNGQPNPGLGALCLDKAGVSRPSSGSWDIGAYYDSGGNSQAPNPPSGLQAVVQ